MYSIQSDIRISCHLFDVTDFWQLWRIVVDNYMLFRRNTVNKKFKIIFFFYINSIFLEYILLIKMIYTQRRRRLSNQINFNLRKKKWWKTRPSRTTSISNKHHSLNDLRFFNSKTECKFYRKKKKKQLMFHQLRRYDNKILNGSVPVFLKCLKSENSIIEVLNL